MLKKLALLVVVTLAALTSCSKKPVGTCENKICDLSFATVTIQFTDKNGNAVAVKDYSAVNQRTNDTIKSAGATIRFMEGYYAVVDDGYLDSLSKDGDDIKVTGTDSVSNQTKSAVLKIAGGKCACHITKVSGPEKIQFD